MWSNLGNTIGSSLVSYAQQKEEAPRRALADRATKLGVENAELQQAALKQAATDKTALDTAVASGLDPDQIESKLPGHLRMSFRKSWNDAEAAAANLKSARAKAEEAEADYWGSLAAGVKPHLSESDGGLGAATIALQHAKQNGYDDAESYIDQLKQNPQGIGKLVEELIQKSPTQRKFAGEESDRALKTKQEERALEAAKQAAADREADNKRQDAIAAETSRHNKSMEARPVAGAQASFQAKEVLGDDGKSTMANFDARTGGYTRIDNGKPIKNPRPIPSALESQDARKFKQADPILRSVDELSEKINTQTGLIAKMSGGVEKVKAQANYNDDVAEYTALIEGFTPLVARALGHTGVLTQQDVDSVKALFPKPGDSKSLRDRKTARIKSIIGDLEAGADGAGATTPSGKPFVGERRRMGDAIGIWDGQGWKPEGQ